MASPLVAPYGSWRSPITAERVVRNSIGLSRLVWDGRDLYWIEHRPQDRGRSVVVRRTPDGRLEDLTPANFNVRSRVHEYGGGAFTVASGTVYFVNASDQRLYRQPLGADPEPLTPGGPWRYADGVIDHRRQTWIGVQADHGQVGEPVHSLVAVSLTDDPPGVQVLASGHDFYASPCLSPDGSHLAWLAWNHPHMPWDGTELWLGVLEPNGSLIRPQRLGGGPGESIFQPTWSPDGVLHFVSDASGWWNLYRWTDERPEPLYPMAAEFGRPQWVFGLSTYGFAGPDDIICTYTQDGTWHLAHLRTTSQTLTPIPIPYTEISDLRLQGSQIALIAGSPTSTPAVVYLAFPNPQVTILRQGSDRPVDNGYLSQPQAITFPTTQGQTAYGFFYPPQNQDYKGPEGETPPLLVRSHGGPTGTASSSLNLGKVQYWTSRGIAVLDVNYRGSTGYGRAYRQQLEGQWGLVEVDDCIQGACYLVEQGWVDGDRLIISGSSAGGYTTLCALTFRNVFRVGASYYGVSDLEALAQDTHKFEARYLDTLIGPYPAQKERYRARSPIHSCDRLACPIIFFQGLQDQVVPPNQAEAMVQALERQKIPVAYLTFKEEAHGFRQAETIQRCLEAELCFYGQILGFTLADSLPPLVLR